MKKKLYLNFHRNFTFLIKTKQKIGKPKKIFNRAFKVFLAVAVGLKIEINFYTTKQKKFFALKLT